MSEKDRIVLLKIKAYISEALAYIRGMDFDAFSNDTKTINASAFVLGQIGELAKLVSQEAQNAAPQIPWRGMRGLRNRIIHDYENLDMKMFWEVLHDDLPCLERQLSKLPDSNISKQPN